MDTAGGSFKVLRCHARQHNGNTIPAAAAAQGVRPSGTSRERERVRAEGEGVKRVGGGLCVTINGWAGVGGHEGGGVTQTQLTRACACVWMHVPLQLPVNVRAEAYEAHSYLIFDTQSDRDPRSPLPPPPPSALVCLYLSAHTCAFACVRVRACLRACLSVPGVCLPTVRVLCARAVCRVVDVHADLLLCWLGLLRCAAY